MGYRKQSSQIWSRRFRWLASRLVADLGAYRRDGKHADLEHGSISTLGKMKDSGTMTFLRMQMHG